MKSSMNSRAERRIWRFSRRAGALCPRRAPSAIVKASFYLLLPASAVPLPGHCLTIHHLTSQGHQCLGQHPTPTPNPRAFHLCPFTCSLHGVAMESTPTPGTFGGSETLEGKHQETPNLLPPENNDFQGPCQTHSQHPK